MRNIMGKRLCACGCGQEIIIKPHHKWIGVPKYIWGHNTPIKAKTIEEVYGKEKRYCACGCGQEVVLKKHHIWKGVPKYIHGHGKKGRTWEEIYGKEKANKLKKHHHNMRINKTLDMLYGEEKAEKIKEKIGEKHKGKNPMCGKRHNIEEWKRNQSMAKKGKRSPRKGLTYEEIYGEKRAKELRIKNSLSKKGRTYEQMHGKKKSEERKKKMSIAMKGRHLSDGWKGKISESVKEQWKDKEVRGRMIRAILKANRKRPTSYEQKIMNLCKKYSLPFKYVGNGEIIIAGKNPDFIETNGKKLIVEVYGRYWKERKNEYAYESKRRKIFAEYGYKTLFLNDDDLLRNDWKSHCLGKIKGFMEE